MIHNKNRQKRTLNQELTSFATDIVAETLTQTVHVCNNTEKYLPDQNAVLQPS